MATVDTSAAAAASASASASASAEFNKNQLQSFYIGLTLALLSSFFIGSSFILKKKGLLKLVANSSPISSNDQFFKAPLRAGQGGYGYLKEWLWWTGLITMGVGELCNFAAYGFVPATLVTPLGALSVLISAIMAAYFLNEKLNTIGKVGCLLTAIGSTMMVIHAPKEGEVKSMADLLYRLQDAEFVLFTILSIVALFALIFYFVPRYGNTNVLIYILICSVLGSFTVMSCKGLSIGIKEMFNHKPTASYMYTFMFAFIVIACIMVQMNYLNKSLDIFNTPIVTTVYYVLFTLFVMIASTLLFKELLNVSFQDFVGCVCGFTTIICALCLIHFFKTTSDQEPESTASTLSNALSSKFNSGSEHHQHHLQSGAEQDSETSSSLERHLNFKTYLAAANDRTPVQANDRGASFYSSSYGASPNNNKHNDDAPTRRTSTTYQQGAKSASYLPENESVILSCPPLAPPQTTSGTSNTNFTFLKRLAQQYKPLGKNILNFATSRSPSAAGNGNGYDSYNYYKLATNETDSLANEEELLEQTRQGAGAKIHSSSSPSSIPASAVRSSNPAQAMTNRVPAPSSRRPTDNEPNAKYLELNLNDVDDDDDDDEDENVAFTVDPKGKLLSAKINKQTNLFA